MVSDVKFSKEEMKLILVLIEIDKKRVSLDEIFVHYENTEEIEIEHLRSSLSARMRHIEWKGYQNNIPFVQKITGIGRGNKAQYSVNLDDAKKVYNEQMDKDQG